MLKALQDLEAQAEALIARVSREPCPPRNRATSELLESEERAAPEERNEAFLAGVRSVLRIVWDDGPRPGAALKHLLVLTQLTAPDLILHMTVDEIAELCGVTKQAWSKRAIAFWGKHLKSKGIALDRLEIED